MNLKISLFKSCGLVFVFLLISISSGFSLTSQPKMVMISEISICFYPRKMDHLEKIAKENNKTEFKKNKKNRDRNIQERSKRDFSTSAHQDEEFESPVKSYNQLKGLLEEVDMMVSGWI